MDANTTIDASLCLTHALNSKQWFDVAAVFSHNGPEPTYASHAVWGKISAGKGVTRPDMILANQSALRLCHGFELRRDISVKGHLGLQVQIRTKAASERVRVFVPPKPFLNLPQIQKKNNPKSKIDVSFQTQCEPVKKNHTATNNQGMSSAWSDIAKIGEAVA